jgi:FMN phosphatase YigB (HAD superfamily)
MKQILTEWRKFIAEEDNLEQNIYSFDFDNTLIRYETLEDGDVEYIGPHEENIALLKNLVEQGNKVIIVTSRSKLNRPKYDWDKAPTPEEAIQEFGLPVEEVYYTFGDLKAEKLLELGVSKHWDDDEEEVEAAHAVGIEATLVPVEGDITERLRDKWVAHMAKSKEETN